MTRFAGWLALLALLAPVAGWNAEPGFTVRRAELFRHEDRSWALDADIDYHFSETAIEAMHNGVPLVLVMRLRVKRVRPWWWDEPVIAENHRRTIRFHPLARAYQLTRAESGITENFASLRALLEELGETRNLPVGAMKALAGGEYRAALSVTLDIESLPLPLRPTAYLSPQWHLNSPWFQWSFAN
ncbi:DUF4390 domain-containing protein [Methylococcus geothermalis]|uniref:DUF4390 domain-containing protein n=1 Tax=Methylococcus geothermalis TaxID=2681310 RepID=A0A858Q5N7_9GAMM|nr:DUF4390 domain-containing protein [Methylococcus geothermalis]QJD29141.1 DUF4390 domain-containing protein [Methylococcus geothermalis]